MEKLSYNIVFNKQNPCGFADIKNSSDTDADSSTDAGMIDIVMKRFNETILVNHQCKITRVSASSFKLVYECSYHGNYKCETQDDISELFYFCTVYNRFIHNTFKAAEIGYLGISTSVEYNNVHLRNGCYRFAEDVASLEQGNAILKEFKEKFIDTNTFGANVLYNANVINSKIDDKYKGYMVSIFSNSPALISIFELWVSEHLGIESKFIAIRYGDCSFHEAIVSAQDIMDGTGISFSFVE